MSDKFLHTALLLIKNQTEFSEFRKWIDDEQQLVLNVLTSSQEDRTVYAAQGAYRMLQKLKNLIEESPRVLEKLAQR